MMNGYCRYYRVPQVMKDVFTNSNVIFVGMGIGVVSKKIEKGQELKISRTVEVKDLAERVNGRGIDYVREEECG
ncbi:hypothetical protein IFM89_004947 [Coptis chinensis]|uniref:Uncharacterized protein n=1 Tax=Coptis chinensis TaxID=261450 RepID=A0A835LYL4_9MAGN|nr:hypothetical protein IFM89_004947 [Coptis chinensis]